VFASARTAFREYADRITNTNAAKHEWFEGFKAFLKSPGSGFHLVDKDVPIPNGRFCSLAGTKARSGDVVRVGWNHNGRGKFNVLVYAGEETFSDRTKPRSFFIYPYHPRLEYNTVSARKHRQYLLSNKGSGTGRPPSTCCTTSPPTGRGR
jgi:hypothetical protein